MEDCEPLTYPADGAIVPSAEWCEMEAQRLGFSLAVKDFCQFEHKYDTGRRKLRRRITVRDGHGGRVIIRIGDRVRWWGRVNCYTGTVRFLTQESAIVKVDDGKVINVGLQRIVIIRRRDAPAR